MPLKRYLLHFGYTGTFFRGVQKHHCRGVPIKPAETVQGLLELCLAKLTIKPLNFPSVTPSSRTDSGVHALCSTAHTDLDFGDYNIFPEQIHTGLNFIFKKKGFSNISVYSVRQVPNTFSARFNAVSRTYIYRVAILKKDLDTSQYFKVTSIPVPVLEVDKCVFILNPNVDLNLIHKACKKFIGTKDFCTFMGSTRSASQIRTERTLYNVELREGKPLYPCPLSENFNFYEFEVTGRAFVYRQVRRIVASLLAVGLKKISLPEIDYLLDNPSKNSWNNDITVPPGCGLYLSSVKYNESDMELTEDNQIVSSVEMCTNDDDEFDLDSNEELLKEDHS